MTHKILISPGFGAGWSTWGDDDPAKRKFMLTYQPLIEFIEGGGKFEPGETRVEYEADGNTPILDALHPVLRQFKQDYMEAFPDDNYVYFGGVSQLTVVEVDGPFRVDEYDGYESVTMPDDLMVL